MRDIQLEGRQMTTFELINNYNLEDRHVESVTYDESQESLLIDIDQSSLTLVFEGVSGLVLKTYPEYNGMIIKKVLEDYGQMSFELYDDIGNDYFEVSFKAKGVTVTEK